MPIAELVAKLTVQQCLPYNCRKATPRTPGLSGKFHAHTLWQTLALDVMGPLQVHQVYQYILKFVYTSTKYVVAHLTKDHPALTVAQTLLNHIFPQYGLPLAIQ